MGETSESARWVEERLQRRNLEFIIEDSSIPMEDRIRAVYLLEPHTRMHYGEVLVQLWEIDLRSGRGRLHFRRNF